MTRAKADMRTMAAALESYAVDNNGRYPYDKTQADGLTPKPLNALSWYISNVVTTPIAYVSNNLLIDPFRAALGGNQFQNRFRDLATGLSEFNLAMGNINAQQAQDYRNSKEIFGMWRLSSAGPDRQAGAFQSNPTYYPTPAGFLGALVIYDPTNGTVSTGDIIRSQKNSDQK